MHWTLCKFKGALFGFRGLFWAFRGLFRPEPPCIFFTGARIQNNDWFSGWPLKFIFKYLFANQIKVNRPIPISNGITSLLQKVWKLRLYLSLYYHSIGTRRHGTLAKACKQSLAVFLLYWNDMFCGLICYNWTKQGIYLQLNHRKDYSSQTSTTRRIIASYTANYKYEIHMNWY